MSNMIFEKQVVELEQLLFEYTTLLNKIDECKSKYKNSYNKKEVLIEITSLESDFDKIYKKIKLFKEKIKENNKKA